MAFYCIDYNNGSNVTGDGTASAPWQTIEHAAAQINGGAGYVTGDEMRIAGSTKSASLGTCTYSTGSSYYRRFNTSVDLTSQFAINDFVMIGDTFTANGGGGDMVFQVAGITSTTIDIYIYSSDWDCVFTTSGTYDIYKISDAVTLSVDGFSGYYLDRPNEVNTPFEVWSNSVVISGGWDPTTFTAKTAYGRTAIGRVGTYQSTNSFPYGAIFTATSINRFNGFEFKDFAITRIYLNRDGSGWTFGCNYTNISANGNIDYGNGADTTSATYTRTLTNITNLAGKFADYFSVSQVPSGGTIFNSCTTIRTNNLGVFSPYGTSIINQVTWNNPTVVSLHPGTLQDILNNYSNNSNYNPLGLLEQDLSQITMIVNSNSGQAIVPGLSAPSPEVTLDLLPSYFTDWNLDAIFGGAWYGHVKFTIPDIEQMIVPKVGQNVRGPWPTTIQDTTTGITWNVLGGKLLAKLNTVDNNTGSNCLELKGIEGELEGPILPFSIKKGDTIDVTVVGKIKGTTASVTPAFRVAAASGTNVVGTEYGIFNQLSNMSIVTSGTYNNSTWSTCTYRLTNAFSTDSVYEIPAQLALYTSGLTDSDSLLIDSITYQIS